MDWGFWLPLLALLSSLVTGVFIFMLDEEQHTGRTFLNLFGAISKLVLVFIMFIGHERGEQYEAGWEFMPGLDFVIRVDSLSILFSLLSASLWLVTTLYAIGYLEDEPNRRRFFGFFSLCVTATMGIALAGNLLTFFVFYELLTITTYPLVVHRGNRESIAAGRTYLLYTTGGGAVMLTGVVWLYSLTGSVDFASGGVLGDIAEANTTQLTFIFGLLIAGLGVKAALFPLHGWLPQAMVAPAPVSALLHAVAVVKAGAYGIVRVVYDVYGIEFASSLGVLTPLSLLAAFTIIYGSIRALNQDELKKRLAFSTVSQLSYIVLGTAIFGPIGTAGGLVHLMHQGLMKITLFFCAGNIAESIGIHHVHEMNGVGRRLPLTMGAFTLASFGMIGIPPMAGFISKWYLGLGGLQGGKEWVVPVLIASSLLNAAYFLPIVYKAWFRPPDHEWTELQPRTRFEVPWLLLMPPLVTVALALASGLFASAPYSPLDLAMNIVEGLYAP